MVPPPAPPSAQAGERQTESWRMVELPLLATARVRILSARYREEPEHSEIEEKGL